MKTNMLWRALLAGWLGSGVSAAWAHGNQPHAGESRSAEKAVDAEQTAWGIAGLPGQVTHTITLDMTDAMRFSPDRIVVKEGDTVRLIVRNTGRMLHEVVIGTPDALAEHAALMARFPGMEHDAPHMAHVSPGKQAEIIWRFNRAGTFEFACLIAGHYEAGMRGSIVVTPLSTQGNAK